MSREGAGVPQTPGGKERQTFLGRRQCAGQGSRPAFSKQELIRCFTVGLGGQS